MSDFYEDLANEMGDPTRTRYLQPDEEETEGNSMGIIIEHQFRDTRQPLLTENDLLNRSVNIYQGPSAHDMMDRTRKHFRPAIMPKWFLITGLLLLAAATGMLVEIMRGLR
jgi:hypothetical protein